jgi:hypothetical protein
VTTKEARLELQRANTLLRRAVENALEMTAAAAEIPTSLERIAESITTVATAPIAGEVQSLKPELEVLRSRMGQLQNLLDGAAAFYCASIARRDPRDVSYAQHGGPAILPAFHQLQLNA